ncbi:MAG: hypothetical protein SZ59_C0003G0081 [candidate division TM6 bacterium GW2011_GWF2_28_16]|nr:MAG: hypothetical protein SZ59_C0003G0081 [candidate division TM6 bacterium GW2011_GWF2_28_16]
MILTRKNAKILLTSIVVLSFNLFTNIKAENQENQVEKVYVEENPTYKIAKEIRNLKEQDEYIKKYLSIKNPIIRFNLEAVRKANIVANENYKDYAKINFVHNEPIKGFGIVINQILKFTDTVYVDKNQAPKLYAVVEKICKKANFKLPYMMIAFSDHEYNSANKHNTLNAMAMPFTPGFTGIVLGEDIINTMSDSELTAIIAHELGHLVNDSNKISRFDSLLSAQNILGSFGLVLLEAIFLGQIKDLYKHNKFCKYLVVSAITAQLTFYAILLKAFIARISSQKHEKNADKFALEHTQDLENFISAMTKLKNIVIDAYGLDGKDFNFVVQAMNELKNKSENEYKKLYPEILALQDFINLQKSIFIDSDIDIHLGFNKRIEFAKKEFEKLMKNKQVDVAVAK